MPNRLFGRKRDVSDTDGDSVESDASSVDSGLPKKKKHGGSRFRNPFARKKVVSDTESIEGGNFSDGIVSDVSADEVKKKKGFRLPFSTRRKQRGEVSSPLRSISPSIASEDEDEDEDEDEARSTFATADSDKVKKKKGFRLPFSTKRKQRGRDGNSMRSTSPSMTSEDEAEDETRSTSAAAESDESSKKISLLERLFPRWRETEDGVAVRYLSPFERLFLRLFHPELFEEDAEKDAQMPEEQMPERTRDRMIEENYASERQQMEKELVLEVNSSELLQPMMEPLLQDPKVKARVAVALHAIRQNANLRSDVSQRLLRALGDLPKDDTHDGCEGCLVCGDCHECAVPHRHRSSAVERRYSTTDYPPKPETGKQFLDPNANQTSRNRQLRRNKVGGWSDVSRVSRSSYTAGSSAAGGSDRSTGTTKFMYWTKMDEHELPALRNFGKESKDIVLAGYEGVNFSVGGGGFNFGLDNFLKMVRGWFIRDDLVALWKSEKRFIRVPKPEPGGQGGKECEDLEVLERKLLDPDKFFVSDKWLTCLTYNRGGSGSITLFSVEMSSRSTGEPRKIRPVAAMDMVPKVILRSIKSEIPPSQRVIVKLGKGKLRGQLKWTLPESMQIPNYETRSLHGQHGGLRPALQDGLLAIDTSEEIDSVSTTVPQMLAWLHLGSPILENVETEEVRLKKHSETRTVKWKMIPTPTFHESVNPRIVVLMPKQGAWASERILWY